MEENLLEPQIFVPYQLWGEFTEAPKQPVIEYNKNIKVVSPKPISPVANLSLTLLWVNLIQIHNKFITMRRLIQTNTQLFVT